MSRLQLFVAQHAPKARLVGMIVALVALAVAGVAEDPVPF